MIPLIIIGSAVAVAVIVRVILIRKTRSATRCLVCGRRMRLRSRTGKTSIYSCPRRSHANVSIERRK